MLDFNFYFSEYKNPMIIFPMYETRSRGPIIENDPSCPIEIIEINNVCPNKNCGKVFQTRESFTKHVNNDCGKLPRFKCSSCDFYAWESGVVVRHANTQHLNQETLVVDQWNQYANTVKRYACPNDNCPSVYNSQSELNRHINNYCGKPPKFKCPYCPYQSKWSKNTRRHVHTRHPGMNINVFPFNYN